jgi:hypothetical protein
MTSENNESVLSKAVQLGASEGEEYYGAWHVVGYLLN